jgi:Ca2+-binding EF-hand superfamily protein
LFILRDTTPIPIPNPNPIVVFFVLVIFDKLDLNRDGLITKGEFMTIEKPLRLLNVLKDLHLDDLPVFTNLEKIFDKIDTKQRNRIQFKPVTQSLQKRYLFDSLFFF